MPALYVLFQQRHQHLCVGAAPARDRVPPWRCRVAGEGLRTGHGRTRRATRSERHPVGAFGDLVEGVPVVAAHGDLVQGRVHEP